MGSFLRRSPGVRNPRLPNPGPLQPAGLSLHPWPKGGAVILAIISLLALFFPASARAQTEPPPSIALDAPRFDASRNLYLLDMVYTRPDAIGTLEISLISPEGVEVLRAGVERRGRNQSAEVDASALQAGQTYTVEVKAFDPAGSPILNSSGGALLATREFTHLPGRAALGDPRFVIDPARAVLTVEVELTSSQPAAGYRVVLESAETKAVALDVRLPAPPPLTVALKDVPPGKYQATIIALDAAGQPLTQAADEFVYQTGATTLGNPLFEYRSDPPMLVVRLQPLNTLPVARYTVALIDKATNQVALDYEAPSNASDVAVPVRSLASGEYRVLVRALDSAGQELAAVEGETTYTAPAPPSLPQRLLSGLAANPIIPILMAATLLAAIAAILIYTRWERRATATPMLHGWNAAGGQSEYSPTAGRQAARSRAGGAAPGAAPGRNTPAAARSAGAVPLPLNRTVVAGDPNITPIMPQPDPAPALVLTVTASPDKGLVGRRIQVGRFPFTMGRMDCDLNVSGDQHISRRHAELHFDGQGLVIIDRLSSNGTYVNGERIAADRPAPLNPSKPVHIQLGRETQLVLAVADRKAGPN